MIPKSMPSGFDPMGGDRFSGKIMRGTKKLAVIRPDPIGGLSGIFLQTYQQNQFSNS
jgi:hypothetical protein